MDKYNKFSVKEYTYIIDNQKKKKLNVLGLYRSILENESLSNDEKIEVREYANTKFNKTYLFYQISHPQLHIDLFMLDNPLNKQEQDKKWDEMVVYQEKTLKAKGIKHRNFGEYSKHLCGIDSCPLNGHMIRAGSFQAETCMSFKSDKRSDYLKVKAKKRKSDRKQLKRLINKEEY